MLNQHGQTHKCADLDNKSVNLVYNRVIAILISIQILRFAPNDTSAISERCPLKN
jgi:hypothetical protein